MLFQQEVAQKMLSAKEAKKVSNFIHFAEEQTAQIAHEAKNARKNLRFQKEAQEQTKTFNKIADKLPEPPKIEEPEPVFVEQQEETE